MGAKVINGLLAILLLVALVSPLFIVAAKPIQPNPIWPNWPGGTLWGARLLMENNTSGGSYFGAKTGAEDDSPAPPSPQQPYIWMVFRGGSPTADQAEIARTEPAAPQSYTWYVKMVYSSGNGDNVDAKIWAELENTTNLFIPKDYSVILENQARSIGPWNLRKENGSINLVDGVTRYATLYVDNAVKIVSIDNLNPLTGASGDNLRLNVHVKNTGRYTDNYTVSSGGSLDPAIIQNLAPGSTDNVIVSTTYPSGTENIVITAAGNYATDQDYITATGLLVVRGVQVVISPSSKSGANGATLTYTVTVNNTGSVSDNFALTSTDNSGWTRSFSPSTWIVVPAFSVDSKENLNVTIPPGAIGGTIDNIKVTATCQENTQAENSANCTAQVTIKENVSVSISPTSQGGAKNATLTYTVTVNNIGNVSDNYSLTLTDNASPSWGPTVSQTSLVVASSSSDNTTTLSVTVPSSAVVGTIDNITVTATSTADNTISGSASCTAQVALKGVNVSISPIDNSGANGATLTYTVTVSNTGNVPDNYSLTVSDNASPSWGPTVSQTSLVVASSSSDNTTTLSVTVPSSAVVGTIDNIKVTATSKTDNTVSASASCTAQATTARSVSVSISPPSQTGANGSTLTYTVTVSNTGNVSDNYNLTVSDNDNWEPTLVNNRFANVSLGENRTTTLRVPIPDNALSGTCDNITVTATSEGDPSVEENVSCIALSGNVFTLDLVAGWNLVSFPVTWDNNTPNNILGNQTYYMWRWDPILKKYSKPLPDQPMELGVGYWIWVDNDMTVTTSGVPVENYSIDLFAGWNLVGFPVTSFYTTPANLFAGENYYMWRWDPILKKYSKPLPDQPMELGVGYWIWVDIDDSLQVHSAAVIRSFSVSISPSYENGPNGAPLTYTVTINNTGPVDDNYALTATDNAVPSWNPSVAPTTLTVSAGGSGNSTLSLTVPDNAINFTQDNITVTAICQENIQVENSASCTAQITIVRGVSVSISPSSQESVNGGTLAYTVTVNNTGNVQENFQLTKGDNAGWTLSLDNNWLLVPQSENRTTKLTVNIPSTATGYTSDNIWVKATSKDNAAVFDNESCLAHVKIVRGVQVVISPSSQENEIGGTLTYTVTVANTGNVSDNYSLTVSDNASPSWNQSVSPTTLTVSAGGSGNSTLSLTVPDNAINFTQDNITVTAICQEDIQVENSASCTAQITIVRGVSVSISPSSQSGANGAALTYTVTVQNTGNVQDTYSLGVVDNASPTWSPSVDNSSLTVDNGASKTTTLRVTVPENVELGNEDNIIVTATSQADITIENTDSCIVHVATTMRVMASILPGENSAFPGENVNFIVAVTNAGDNVDDYVLYASDSLRWGLSLADNSMDNAAPEENRTTTLTVSIPENAAPDAMDNITVTVTSRENENVTDNATCIAHSIAIIRGVKLSISPAQGRGMPGDEVSYTVSVTNTGNITDNYDLTVSDNADWSPSISDYTVEVPAGENVSPTISVTVPDNAAPGTMDRITVTATSQENSAITASASCVGRALILNRVEVTISPGYRSGSPKDTLYFTVYVTNAGQVTDTFDLRTTTSGDWISHVEPTSLTLDPGQSDNAMLSVYVPSDAKAGDTGLVEVRAVSTTDSSVQSADTCRAVVLAPSGGVGKLSIPWLLIIIIAALIAGAVFAVGYLTRMRERRRPRSISRMLVCL